MRAPVDYLISAVLPPHRDRTTALRAGLARLGEVAAQPDAVGSGGASGDDDVAADG